MMSCTGNPYVRTPNMDYIAQNGVRFTNAYCANPVCQPSRFSLMTGLYPSAGGLSGDGKFLPDTVMPPCIPENALGAVLKRQGYEAVYGGKQGIPGLDATGLGFDYFYADEREGLADGCADYIHQRRDGKPFAMVASFINPHDICLMAIDDFAELADNDADKRIVRQCEYEINSVRQAAKLPEGMHRDVFFDTICPPLPLNHLPPADEPGAIGILLRERGFRQLARERYTAEQWRLHRWAFAKLTETVDAQVGKVINSLIENELWDNTVVILTSDHGDMDASHKMEHKSAFYQECVKVPLLLKGVKGGYGADKTTANGPFCDAAENTGHRTNDALVSNGLDGDTAKSTGHGTNDAPVFDGLDGNTAKSTGLKTNDALVSNGLDSICTILDYAGAAKPAYMPGISLRPYLEDGAPPPRKYLIVEGELGCMAADKRHKYVRYNDGVNNEQFYDLVINSGEQYNQIDDVRYADKLQKLKNAVENHTGK